MNRLKYKYPPCLLNRYSTIPKNIQVFNSFLNVIKELTGSLRGISFKRADTREMEV